MTTLVLAAFLLISLDANLGWWFGVSAAWVGDGLYRMAQSRSFKDNFRKSFDEAVQRKIAMHEGGTGGKPYIRPVD